MQICFYAQPVPVAKFSFNNNSNEDEISHRKPKLVNTNFVEDRFGNPNSAIFVFGNLDSYINLGNYPVLKPQVGSISLWVKIENAIYSGIGIQANPIIVTRNCKCPDFNEAYALSYAPYKNVIEGTLSNDSIRQIMPIARDQISFLTWYHLVLTYDYDRCSLYLNGQLKSSFEKKFNIHFEPMDSVILGVINNEHNKRCLRAVLDDIEFYNKVLNEKEVTSLYNAPNPNKRTIFLHRMLWVLSGILLIVIIYVALRFRFRLKLKKEKRILELNNKQLENELRINRALMNPHFVFNAMNTLHNLILNSNNEKASDYLIKFSKLLRKILDSNMSDTISLDQEIELIEMYLEIESMRFREQFAHQITLSPDIIPSTVIIPIMMLQPFIENSVWHGLRDKTGEKRIEITFSFFEENYLQCTIEDNGTGRKKRESNPGGKKSLATNFVMQRLALLNKIHNLNCSLSIIDKENDQGTIVKIILPLLNKLK